MQSRRTFLTLSTAGIGALLLTSCSQTPVSAPKQSASSSLPSPTAPSLGVHEVQFLQTGIEGVDIVATGARGVVVESGHALTAYLTDAPTAIPLSSPTPSTAQETSSTGGVEQSTSAAPSAVLVTLAKKAGSGLSATSVIISASFVTGNGDSKNITFPVAWSNVQLVAATVCDGVVLAVGISNDDFSVPAVAFDQKGELWSSKQLADIPSHATGYTQPMLWGNARGQFIAAGDATATCYDTKTGQIVWSAELPHGGGGAITAAPTFFTMSAFSEGGYGEGIRVFSSLDGKPIELGSPRDVAYDPIAQTVAFAYTTNEVVSNNEAHDDGTSPALAVVNSATWQPAFTLNRADAKALGQLDVASAFDGRLIIKVSDGLRIINETDGSASDGFSDIPPDSTIKRMPYSTSPHWALLRSGNLHSVGADQSIVNSSRFTGLVYSDSPLTWNDMKTSIAAP